MINLQEQIELIEAEFRREFRSVIDQITLPIPQRVDSYTCWPGLTLLRAYDARSTRLHLGFKSNPSKIRVGEHVYVNSMSVEPKDVITAPRGVVESLDETTKTCVIKPAFRQESRFERRFQMDERIVLDLTLPGEHLSREMPILALRLLNGDLGTHPRLRLIRAILDGETIPAAPAESPADFDADPQLARLTSRQKEAVARSLKDRCVLIQGPPGTGKTMVLGLIIREFVRRGRRVGVCAFTHQAINNVLLECLKHQEISTVAKLGSKESWTGEEPSDRFTLEPSPGAFFRRKVVPDVAGFTQHAAFAPVARAAAESVDKAMFSHFDVIIFDEAGQLLVPAALMGMFQAERFVFAGDHRQLPPVISSRGHRPAGARSVFEVLVHNRPTETVLLDTSFRMNREILAFPSQEFYGGQVVPSATSAIRRLQGTFTGPLAEILNPDRPVSLGLVHHHGRGQESIEEAILAAEIAATAVRGGVPADDIAIIAPHRRQNTRIREFLAERHLGGGRILVDTVERIQGQERSLIIVSMTVSDPDVLSAECEFLFMPNRFNVAMTRARAKLIVLASPLFFRVLPRRENLDRPPRNQGDWTPLGAVNVLKRWYFAHRAEAMDLSALAAGLPARPTPGLVARDLTAGVSE